MLMIQRGTAGSCPVGRTQGLRWESLPRGRAQSLGLNPRGKGGKGENGVRCRDSVRRDGALLGSDAAEAILGLSGGMGFPAGIGAVAGLAG